MNPLNTAIPRRSVKAQTALRRSSTVSWRSGIALVRRLLCVPVILLPLTTSALGSYQAGLGVGTLAFWSFMIGLVPLGLRFAWIYNRTGALLAIAERTDTNSIVLWFVAAIGITLAWGAKTLVRRSNTTQLPNPEMAAR